MFLKKRVIVGDIYRSPLWKKYLPVVAPYGLRACWSLPIIDSEGNVIASFASYYLVPKLPNETELNLIERAANLIKIIIENKKAEEKLRISNERYFLATRATKDAIWDWDIVTQFVYWGEAFFLQFGYTSTGEETARFEFWKENIHPDDRERVVTGLRNFVSDKRRDSWQDEYRFKRGDNHEYALVIDRGFLVLNDKEEVIRMIGSMEDITESRELEKKLLKQEIDKQRLVAQAMVDTQEKERAEIGKELHDNVNQILSTTKLYLELAKTNEADRLNFIERSAASIHNVINEIRGISRSLVPPSFSDLGLLDSVVDLVNDIIATKTIHVEFYHQGDFEKNSTEKLRLTLFRIIQEQVNNVIRHANAKHLVIELMMEDEEDAIDLTITDDGVGFDPDAAINKKGMGISNIFSRTALFDGHVILVSAPGEGCKLHVHVPIHKHAKTTNNE
jgi:PAS domain S-box-containing protein